MNNPNPSQAPQDNYQSHREFGRDLSNTAGGSAAQHTQLHGHQLMVHPILSTKAAAATNTGNNISIFKNFISQYQSSNGAAAP